MSGLDPFTQDTLDAMLGYVADDARIARHLRIDIAIVRRARAARPPAPPPPPAPGFIADDRDDRALERRAAKLGCDALLAALRRAGAR